jgi:undecaprenyl-diphosphatase
MEIFYAVLLGVLQGITEWLPVSSSGHLAIAQNLFGLEAPVIFDIFLHLGTALAGVVFLKEEIFEIVFGWFNAIKTRNFKNPGVKLSLMVITASIPTALIGFAFKDFFEGMFFEVRYVGAALIITAVLLFAGERAMGIFQGFAVAPGVSRSGSTLAGGMLLGNDKEKIARFSFLISLPAILGAGIFEGMENASLEFIQQNLSSVLAGFFVSAVVGYFSMRFLIDMVRQGKLWWFGVYCIFLGGLVILI